MTSLSKGNLQLDLAKRQAEKLLEELNLTALPVDPVEIAKLHGIEVDAFPDTEEGVSAMLLRYDNKFGIFYSTSINNTGFQRFSIAHELGHYFLDGHSDQIFSQDNVHSSSSGSFSRDPFEQEADAFASGLLMPRSPFRRAINDFPDGLAAIKGLALRCQTSLTATAIRYVELSDIPVAVIVSSGRRIVFPCMSTAMKRIAGITWLCRGDLLPQNTLTSNFNNIRDLYDEREQADEVDAQVWLGCRRGIDATEEVIYLGSYNKTLTVLTCPETDEGEGPSHDFDRSDREASNGVWPLQFPSKRRRR